MPCRVSPHGAPASASCYEPPAFTRYDYFDAFIYCLVILFRFFRLTLYAFFLLRAFKMSATRYASLFERRAHIYARYYLRAAYKMSLFMICFAEMIMLHSAYYFRHSYYARRQDVCWLYWLICAFSYFSLSPRDMPTYRFKTFALSILLRVISAGYFFILYVFDVDMIFFIVIMPVDARVRRGAMPCRSLLPAFFTPRHFLRRFAARARQPWCVRFAAPERVYGSVRRCAAARVRYDL